MIDAQADDVSSVPNASRSPIRPLASVECEDVDFLWRPYLPKGKVAMLVGDPAVGKTWLALTIASIISRGWPFPSQSDGMPRGEGVERGRVLYLSGEDDPADTLRPRLESVGGDPESVFFWDYTAANFPTLKQLQPLEDALLEIGPALLVVDPLQAFFGGVDMHRSNEVRPVLLGLMTLAKKFNCTILCLTHLRKGQADNALYRALGSIDFVAAIRSLMLVGYDPTDNTRRIFTHPKPSLSQKGISLGFSLTGGSLEWLGKTDHSAEDLLVPFEATRITQIDEAAKLLKELLASTPMKKSEVVEEAAQRGISESALNRAKTKLGILSQSSGFPAVATWSLPASAARTDTTAKTERAESLDEKSVPVAPTSRPSSQLTQLSQSPQTSHVVAEDVEPGSSDSKLAAFLKLLAED